MGFKKAILAILLLIILTMGAASAADTNTTSDNLAATEDTNLELNENDKTLSIDSTDVISGPGNGSYTPGNGSIVTGKTFSDLDTLIQNAESELILNDDYTYSDGDSDYITISKNGFTIDGNGHTINSMSKSRIFYITAENVVLKNINFINGSSVVRGGAIHWNGENGTLSNCNFINNSAIGTSTGGGGGAVYINSNCKVVNCNFTNNQVSDNYEGGAIYFYNNGNVTNCNFVNNTGAVYFLMGNGNVTNCNFTNNIANRYGGAIYFNREGNVTNCNFINNQAHDSYDGGAIRIGRNGIVTNCNFTNNTANFGGAIYIIMKGKVTNSNFIANSAKSHGGAIYIEGKSNVSNCNFTNNTASYYGGAIRFESDSNITNSNFIANSAKSHGGAIYIEGKSNVSNCNFTNNTAKNYGGAVYFEVGTTNNVTNCNFIKCSAENAKAIYANNNTLISSCNFETQGSESLSELVVGGIISNCTINGNKEKTEPHMTVTVEDITYGENATFTVTLPSDATGILNITVGNMAFTADVSNEPIITKFSGLDIGTYIANITYTGDLKYLPANASKTFTVNSKANKTFTDLKNLIDATSPGDTIKLEDDYTNDGTITADGIAISKAITIDGNGHTLNANGKSRTFVINTSGVTIKNTIFTNGHQDNTGSAIYWSGCTVNVLNCTFINNAANYDGGAIGWTSSPNSSVTNCTFINNTAQMGGGAIYSSWTNNWSISNCVFINSYARYDGGAIITWGDNNGLICNCTFEDNSAGRDGETIFWYNGNGNIDNSKFININKHGGKVIYSTNTNVIISNSNFEDETVENLNDIIYGGTVINCTLNSPSTKIDPSMTITTTDIHYGENATINISISNDATGNVTITVDNNAYELPIIDGKATLTINNLETGTYTAYATYPGDIKYLPTNTSTTFTVNSKANKTFTDLKNLIDSASSGDTIELDDNYTNDGSITADGITISKPITIDGNGHTLNANGKSGLFKLNVDNIILNNIEFLNASHEAISVSGSNCKIINCNFNNCSPINSSSDYGIGGGVVSMNSGSIVNCSFINCVHDIQKTISGGVLSVRNSDVINCRFFNCTYGCDLVYGGAIYLSKSRIINCSFSYCGDACNIIYGGAINGEGSVINCTFSNCTIDSSYSAYVHFEGPSNLTNSIFIDCISAVCCNYGCVGNITNCTFEACSVNAIVFCCEGGNVTNCKFNDCTSTAIHVVDINVNIVDCTFKNCSSTYEGGAINIAERYNNVINCSFIDCSAERGGAIYAGDCNNTIINCSFINCSAQKGGSIYWNSKNGKILNSNFTHSQAENGGAIYVDKDIILTVSSSKFEYNTAEQVGGAIYFNVLGNVTNCTFNGNSNPEIYPNNRTSDTNSTFTELKDLIDSANSGDTIDLSGYYYGSGSSISIDKTVTLRGIGETVLDAKGLSSILSVSANNVRIENIKFVNGQNSGNWGGAIHWEGDSGVLINSTFVNNVASWGAGIFWWAQDGYMANCTFENNTAERYGGALYVNGENLRMLNSLFKNNIVTESISSWEGGGAIYTDGNNHLVANSTFIDNKAINSWGGAIKHGSETASYQSNEFYNNTAIRGNSVWESDANNLVNNIFNLNSIDEIASCVEDANLSVLFENNIFKVKGIVISKDDYFNETDTGSNESSQNITQSTFTDITNLISNAHGGDTINLEGTYYGTGSIITVNKELTINGDGETVLDAKNLSGIMSVSADNVRINNIRFVNGKINANGGAINWIGKNGTISNCTFINCSAENGGSVYWNAENGRINTSRFDHSTATQNGGAIYWNANSGEIANSIFTNSYAQNGGAVYVPENRTVEIKSSIFDNNMAEEESGAVYGGTVNEDCTFKNNTYTPLNTTTIISINETAVYSGNDISITTLILSQKGGLVNTGKVEIYINSKLIATIPANTAYIYKTGDLGTYQVLAKFNDDSSYNSSSSTSEFTVIPVDIQEEIETSTAGIFTLEFPDDAEGTLTVFIDGTKYKVYDIVGGILKIDLSNKKGKHTVTFEYSGDKNYPSFEKEAKVTVKTNPSITASNPKVLYTAGPTYKITVYKNKGVLAKGVSVVIKQNNKKFKTIKTNSKGIASFKVTQTPGTYKLKITSLGKTVTKTITVKHIITLKTVNVKKSAKKLILQATLAKVNKKYLKNKWITFKFNGKKYKAKTNKKGVAKVTIKANILKKLKAGKKITYQATYLKDTFKKTAKVKK